MSGAEATGRTQFLSFTLAGGDYGIGILQLKEILQYEALTPVPSAPGAIRGVINLRGAAVPVMDLAVKFGLPETRITKQACILIVEASLGEGQPLVVGIMADDVQEVLELGPEQIEPSDAFGSLARLDFLVGMGKVGKKFVLLLDIDRVISADERGVAAGIAGAADGSTPPSTSQPQPLPAPQERDAASVQHPPEERSPCRSR